MFRDKLTNGGWFGDGVSNEGGWGDKEVMGRKNQRLPEGLRAESVLGGDFSK